MTGEEVNDMNGNPRWRRATLSFSSNRVEVAGKFRKPSYSMANGNCVEVAGKFRKPSYSTANGHCVEVAGEFTKSSYSFNDGSCVESAGCECGVDVLVRDSKDKRPDAPVLSFSKAVWAEFLAGVKAGEL